MRFFVCSIIAASAIFAQATQNGENSFVIVNSGSSSFVAGEYSSGERLFRDSLDKNQQKNHTISDMIKQNPNITVNEKSASSTEAGEISPQDFSINGSSFYQNSFNIDGLSFNNDLDPAGYRTLHKNIWRPAILSSQMANIDTDLLGSLEVLDSAVSARYGGFQGGVVNAKTRDPKRGFGGIISYGYTSGDLSEIFVDSLVMDKYKNATGWIDKSDFVKQRYRVGLEGSVSENFGLLFDYTSNSSLYKNPTKTTIMNDKYSTFPDDKRRAENYLIKGVWLVNDSLSIKPQFLYARQKTRTFIEWDKGSQMDAKFGGWAASLQIDNRLKNLNINQNIGYSKYEASRYFDNKYGLYGYKKSNIKNWGGSDTNDQSWEGSLNDIKQLQTNFNYNVDVKFNEFGENLRHKIAFGGEFIHQSGTYETLTPFLEFDTPLGLPSGYVCDKNDRTCINDDSFGGLGQFLSVKYYFGDVKNSTTNDKISLYFEDDMRYKRLKIRPGIRIERDSFNGDINLAPRFVTELDLLGDENHFAGFGLNRYYGRNLFSYEIFNDMYSHYATYERNHPDESFAEISRRSNSWKNSKLKTPYDDEFSLFYRGIYGNLKTNLKYIRRASRDEVVGISESRLGVSGSNFSVYTNGGKSDTNIVSLAFANDKAIEFIGGLHHFGASASWTHQKRNFQDYRSSDIDDLVVYKGSVIKKSQLPPQNLYTPIKASAYHTMAFNQYGISLTNRLNYTGSNDIYIRGYDSNAGLTSYTKEKLKGYATWDLRLSVQKKVYNDFSAFANFDINNVLNKRYAVDGGTVNNEIYYDYGLGRNFWFEVGLKW